MALALLCVLALAGCGGSVKASDANPDFVALTVIRTSAFAENRVLPFADVAIDEARIDMLYRAFLALPIPAPGIYSCPADLGMAYHLSFIKLNGAILHASVNASGCEWATMDGITTRWTNDA